MPSKSTTPDPKQVRAQARAYLVSLSPAGRRAVRAIGDAIRSAAPAATEAFSYGIPGFRFEGRPLVWYAAFTSHASMYPIGSAIRRTFASELAKYKTSTGTVQFPLEKPMPVALVKRLVKARVAEIRTKEKA